MVFSHFFRPIGRSRVLAKLLLSLVDYSLKPLFFYDFKKSLVSSFQTRELVRLQKGLG